MVLVEEVPIYGFVDTEADITIMEGSMFCKKRQQPS